MFNSNYLNFNMMNTGWGGLLQQGLNMFGGNSYGMMGMGGSIFGCGNNFFSNCFGEPNYDAIAGFGVANALTEVLGQGVSQIKAQKAEAKQAEVNAEARLETINVTIREKEASIKVGEDVKDDYNKKIDNLNQDIQKLSQSKSDLNALKAKWDEAYAKDPNSPDAKTAEEAYKNADKKNKEIDAKIKTKQEELKDITENKLPECESKIQELKEEVAELEQDKIKLQEQVTKTKLAKAQGKKYQATKQEDFNAKWDNGAPKTGVEFTPGDMRFAIGQLGKAVNENDKKTWSQKINTIYTYFLNNDNKSITSDFKFAAETAKKNLKA